MDKWRKDKNIDLILRMIVHDEAVYTVNKYFADECGEQFKQFVKQVGEQFKSNCVLSAAYKSGGTWACGH